MAATQSVQGQAQAQRLDWLARPSALTLVIVGVAALGSVFDLAIPRFGAALAALLVGSWQVARTVLRMRWADDAVIVTACVAAAWLGLVAEVLSLGHLLGSQAAWLGGCLAAYGVGLAAGRPDHPLDWRTPLRPFVALNVVGRLLLVAFAVPLATMVVLVWFSGITISDSFLTYLPRATHYLQEGTFEVYTGRFDYFPYLHTVLVMFPMLFLRSDIHVNVLSMVFSLLASVSVAAFARSLGWRGGLILVAAGLSWTMPKYLMSSVTSGFDIVAGFWIVTAVYALRRGYAATSPRWLAVAALATALALATKPTFWFAAPGLAVVWALCLLRALRRGRRCRLVGVVSVAATALVLVGMPFMIRNMVMHGYLIAPPADRERLAGQAGRVEYSLSLDARARAFAITVVGGVVQLGTPPFYLPETFNREVDPWMASFVRTLGSPPEIARWGDGLLRHGSERYNAGMAGYGGAVPLVILPSILAALLLGRRLGPRRQFIWWCIGVGISSFAIMSYVLPLAPAVNRYFIEWLLLVAVVAPALFAAMPARVRGVAVCILAVPLILEMYDTLQHSRHLPLRAVTTTSREDQQFVWFGWPDRMTRQAARVMDQKHPADALPLVYVTQYFTADYFFNGPALNRRTQVWIPPPSGESLRLRGPTLTQDPGLADRAARQADIVTERLSANTWLLHPLDRLVVTFDSFLMPDARDRMIRIHAHVPPAWSARPEFRVVLIPDANSQPAEFQPSATMLMSLAQMTGRTVRVEARAAERPGDPLLSMAFDWRRFDWLDAVPAFADLPAQP